MFEFIKKYLFSNNKTHYSSYRMWLHCAIISILAVVVFINIFQNNFVYDDTDVFLHWPAVQNMDIGKLLQGAYPTKFQGQAYRPIKGIIQAVDYKIWGENPIGYHIQAIILNLIITILIYFLTRKITKSSIAAFITAVLFGIHPVHTEAITFMTASVDIWGVLFFFLSFYGYLMRDKGKWYRVLSFITAFLAFFTYEMTLTLPLVIISYDICFKKIQRSNFYKTCMIYAPYWAFFVLFFVLRTHFLGHVGKNSLFAVNPYLTTLTMIKVVGQYLFLLVLPLHLSISPILSGGIEAFHINDLTYLDPIKAQHLFDIAVLLPAAVIIGLVCFACMNRRKTPILSFAIFFITITLLPVLNIIPLQVIMAERYEYIASFGGMLFFGYLFSQAYTHKKIIHKKYVQNSLIIGMIGVVVVFSFLTLTRNTAWKDDLHIWKNLADQPIGGAEKNFYTGLYHFQKGDYGSAAYDFNTTIHRDPNYVFAYYYLVLTYLNQGDSVSAQKTQARLAAIRPSSDTVRKLGELVKNTKHSSAKWPLYDTGKIIFSYPPQWSVANTAEGLVLTDQKKTMTITLTLSQKPSIATVDQYVAQQNTVYGTLTQQGLANIPSFDTAYIRIWQKGQSQNYQFFLFKGTNVVEVLVSGFTNQQKQFVDGVIGSLKLK